MIKCFHRDENNFFQSNETKSNATLNEKQVPAFVS